MPLQCSSTRDTWKDAIPDFLASVPLRSIFLPARFISTDDAAVSRSIQVAILSDVHYACQAEQVIGNNYEFRLLRNPVKRFFLKLFRHHVWLREPTGHNARLDEFIAAAGSPDWVIANGDYNCDTKFLGVSNDDSCQSARECLGKLRAKFAPNFRAIFGDHELGKLSLIGASGGMRFASFLRAQKDLGLEPLWQVELGRYVFIGVTSTLIALPLFKPDMLPEESQLWKDAAAVQLEGIRRMFSALKPDQRVILFCHDPSALPFLWREDAVREKLDQVEQTIVGHLHTNLVFSMAQILSGIPKITFLGKSVSRMSAALSEARHWRPFNVRLCPSLAGIELRKDGGFYTMELDLEGNAPAKFTFHPLKR